MFSCWRSVIWKHSSSRGHLFKQQRLLFLHFPGNSDSRTKPRDHQSAWQAPWRALNPGDSFLGILPAAEIMLGAVQHSRYHWSQTAVTTSVPVPGCPQLAPHPTLTCRLRLPAQQDRTPGYKKSHSLDLSLQHCPGQCHRPWDQVWAVPGTHCACTHRCKSANDQATTGDGATVESFLMVHLFFWSFSNSSLYTVSL